MLYIRTAVFTLYSKLIFRGHGTFMHEDKLHASVAGVVERVNKLICVRPLKTRQVVLFPNVF